MKGRQQVHQMTGSMRDTTKLIKIDDDTSEHLCRQWINNWKISNHALIIGCLQTVCIYCVHFISGVEKLYKYSRSLLLFEYFLQVFLFVYFPHTIFL